MPAAKDSDAKHPGASSILERPRSSWSVPPGDNDASVLNPTTMPGMDDLLIDGDGLDEETLLAILRAIAAECSTARTSR